MSPNPRVLRSSVVGCALVVAALMAAPARSSVYPQTERSQRAAEADREDAARRERHRVELLARVAAALDGRPGSTARASSIPRILSIAADPSASPASRHEAETLLTRAATNSDPTIARQAERALDTLRELADQPRWIESRTEEQARRRERSRQNLQRLMVRLADTRLGDRRAEASAFAALATSAREIDSDVRAFAHWMRRDPDPQVARWGETVVARLEGRSPDPLLAPPYRPSPTAQRRADEREQELIDLASDPNPRARRDALRRLIEIVLHEGREGDPRLLSVFEAALRDPDSRVSACARFMLAGLAGDRHAAGMVWTEDSPRGKKSRGDMLEPPVP